MRMVIVQAGSRHLYHIELDRTAIVIIDMQRIFSSLAFWRFTRQRYRAANARP